MRNLYIFLLLCIEIIFISSCASIGTLSGGDKDIVPPKIVKSNPTAYSVNYNKNLIQFTLDEYFTLNSPLDSIRITPTQQKAPEFEIKGKTLNIRLKDEIKPNTTYHIDISRGALSDITENNKMPDTKFVYSTGNYVDSFEIKGKVIDMYTQKPVSGACVMLYTTANDSSPIKEIPSYFTLTDYKGNFEFDHIQNQKYQLNALMDKNFNRKFDRIDEKIAFLPDNNKIYPSLPNMDSIDYTLYLFRETEEKTKLINNYTKSDGVQVFVFNKAINDFKIKGENFDIKYSIEMSKEKDSVFVYFYDTNLNSTKSYVISVDTLISDTISFSAYEKKKNTKQKKNELTSKLSCHLTDAVEIDDKFSITFDFPLKTVDTSAFVWMEINKKDSNLIYAPIKLHERKITWTYALKGNTSYMLVLKDSSCLSYNGLYNDSIVHKFYAKTKKNYGRIKIHLEFPDKNNYIVELVDRKSVV